MLQSIYWNNGKIVIIDQTKLPRILEYRVLDTLDDVAEAIINMRVRGAPLIGVTAALGLAMVAYKYKNEGKEQVMKKLEHAADVLCKTRPTAVNLFNAINRVLNVAHSSSNPASDVIEEALKMLREDIEVNQKIANIGEQLIDDGDVILTHCNTGALATVAIGTALGVIIQAHKNGKHIKVYATETRPKMQGSRLTMYELIRAGIEAYLIPDTAVAHTFSRKGINKVFLGADRILLDGTLYNKIGTFQIAILSKYFGAKFYTVAPTSTIDLQSLKSEVVIEERSREELIYMNGVQTAPLTAKVFNPAFDETPPYLIDAIVTEKGVIYPPFSRNISKILQL